MKAFIALQFFVLCVSNTSLVVGLLYNAALYKPAWQSSTIGNRPASLGNDGNTVTKSATSYFLTETGYDDPAWWMVDLKGQYVTEQIVFTNRNDGKVLSNRLHNFQIDVFKTDPRQSDKSLNVSGDVCFNRTDPVDGGTFTWNCYTPLTGRYVRLIRYTRAYLNVVELQVMVSRELIAFTTFTRRLDSILDVTLLVSLNVSSPKECVQRCPKLKSAGRCTAFNWVTSTNTCQLLSIDTRQKDVLLSKLKSSSGVNFYMEG